MVVRTVDDVELVVVVMLDVVVDVVVAGSVVAVDVTASVVAGRVGDVAELETVVVVVSVGTGRGFTRTLPRTVGSKRSTTG